MEWIINQIKNVEIDLPKGTIGGDRKRLQRDIAVVVLETYQASLVAREEVIKFINKGGPIEDNTNFPDVPTVTEGNIENEYWAWLDKLNENNGPYGGE